MLGACDVIAFVGSREPARAKAFYQQVLGLRFVADDPPNLIFDANGTMLRIAKVQQFTPAENTVLGWKVPNIRSTVEELTKKGVSIQRYATIPQDDLGIWEAPDGTKVAWFKDPDGNNLSLTEFRL